jgi:nucleotide-binding universal stress UspA family protein
MYGKILVPFDGGINAMNGLNTACILAEHHKSKLILLFVARRDLPADFVAAAVNEGIVHPSSYAEFSGTLTHPAATLSHTEAAMVEEQAIDAKMKHEAILAQAASSIGEQIVDRGSQFAGEHHVPEILTLVRTGEPERCILDVAKQFNVDLIVIGSHGKEGVDALLHPSVAENVRKHANCPCLVLFPGKHV